MKRSVNSLEIQTRRKILAESKRHMMELRESIETEIRRLNSGPRPIDGIKAQDPTFKGSDYLKRPEDIEGDSHAWLAMLGRLGAGTVQFERMVLRTEKLLDVQSTR